MRYLRYTTAILILFAVASTSACSCNDETRGIDNQGEVCTPDEAECDDGAVLRCNEDGTGFLEPQGCDGDVCIDGQCGCTTAGDCADGEVCDDGLCECSSQVYCDGTCCGDGEVCDQVEICDDDGSCESVSLCRPACEGSFCGLTGELCCEGDTPECGPFGQCAPDCSGGGGLCGENFDECCAWGDYCIFGECRTGGEPCEDLTECGFGEYCDLGLGRCMPDDFPDDIQCNQEGEFEEMDIVEKWSWTEENITGIPLVGDVTGDGEPNVVVNTFDDNIIILDSSGEEIRRIVHDPDGAGTYGVHWRSNMALGDLTGDGALEIIYPTRISGCCSGNVYIAAVDGQGNHLWLSHDENGTPVQHLFNTGAIGVANFDGDPNRAQVMAGAVLINHDGLIMWNEGGQGTEYGSAGNYYGGLSIAVDLTGDGNKEIVTGAHAWTVNWPSGASHPDDVTVEILWHNTDGVDGYPAVADMDGNGKPEVILFAGETVRILDGQTGKLWCGIDPTGQACEDDDSLRTQPKADPSGGGGRGGAPTVADFTGDGRPEIGAAGRDYYTVFDIYRPGFGDDDTPEIIDEDLLAEHGQDFPELGEIFIRWYIDSQDSSRATGSSVFDFQGDGVASVIYNDECYLRVLDGRTGEFQLEIANSSGTRIEYPIVVDVDGNGRSEIVVVANDQSRSCANWYGDSSYQERSGVYVYEDPNELWVHTRSIWNQHAYHIDNINDDGSLPMSSPNSWETHNTFRANRQGEVPLNAADVAVTSVQVNTVTCPPEMLFLVTIENEGISSIPAGMPVSIYDVTRDLYLFTIDTEEAIPPGGVITVNLAYQVSQSQLNLPMDLMIIANDDGDGEGIVYDCNPDKASYVLDTVECRIEL